MILVKFFLDAILTTQELGVDARRPQHLLLVQLEEGHPLGVLRERRLADVVFRDKIRLHEDLPPHKSLESFLVELGLNCGEEFLVGSQELGLHELLRLLVAVPELEEVDY